MPFESEDHPLEGILKRTGTIKKEEDKAIMGCNGLTLSSAQYTIVLLPGHPDWREADEEEAMEATSNANGTKRRRPKRLEENVDFQFKAPSGKRRHLVHSILRTSASSGNASSGLLHSTVQISSVLSSVQTTPD